MLHKHDPYKVFDINTAGTLNVIEAARKHGTKRLVFLSTFVAYGEQKDIASLMRPENKLVITSMQQVKQHLRIFCGLQG